jgi:uncharacterized protein YceK
MRTMRFQFMMALAASLFVSACATVSAVEESPDPAEEAEVEVVLADYEDFNVEPYREIEPSRREISHDVPAVLMDGRAGEGTVRTVQGFRIQIASSVERYDAVLAEEQAKSWWREDGRSGTPSLFGADLPTYVVYMQPYYRVRVGNFTSRAEAQRALSAIERQFPGSFIVPDTVTVISRAN